MSPKINPEAFKLLRAMADGRPLELARFARCRRIPLVSVRKHLDALRAAGLPVVATRGAGWQLAWPVEPLDEAAIRRWLGDEGIALEVLDGVDSTNRYLADRFRHRCAVLAEYQWQGRGRRGRGWLSPPACGLHLSFGFRFGCAPSQLGPLGPVAGIAAAEVVRSHRVGAALKWPNDLIVGGRKLGGLLTEIRSGGRGPCQAVLGIGVNCRLPSTEESPDAMPPDQPWTDLYRASGRPPERNRLAACLLSALARACERFEAEGFEPFRARWQKLDVLAGRAVRVLRADGSTIVGIAHGLSGRGALKIESAGRMIELDAGEVSVRVA